MTTYPTRKIVDALEDSMVKSLINFGCSDVWVSQVFCGTCGKPLVFHEDIQTCPFCQVTIVGGPMPNVTLEMRLTPPRPLDFCVLKPFET